MVNRKVSIKINFPYVIFNCLTAMIGYHIHSSIFWSIVDWLFAPIVWIKWLICQDVNMTIIRETFSFFFK